MASLNHANVLRYWGVVIEPKNATLVIEYCRGGDLYDNLYPGTNFPEPKQKSELLHGISAGLAEIHSLCKAHRDVKPQNILLLVPPETLQEHLSAFGTGKRVYTLHVKKKLEKMLLQLGRSFSTRC